MERVTLIGRAQNGSDSFDFKIGPWAGGIGLMIKRTSERGSLETGAGIWPSTEKAKEIANQAATKAFGRTVEIDWSFPNP